MTAGVVTARDVGVRFHFDRQRRLLSPTMARIRRGVTESHGLRDLHLRIGAGESVALLGQSGAGKTTLLRCLAGVVVPDAGRLDVAGPVASLLSVDAGLMPTLTGRENALLLAVLCGFSPRESRRRLPEIREECALGQAFDRPVASYSQGMRARLGFAVVTLQRPRLLLLDEVHEALDHVFRAVVEKRARDVLEGGGAVVAAGHDHELLEHLCTRAVHLEDGSVAADGPFAAVREAYLAGLERPADR